MSKVTLTALIIVGLIGLLLVAVLASRVGGIAIRNNVTRTDEVALAVSQPVVRGVPVAVRWAVPDENDVLVHALLRDQSGEQLLGEARLLDGVVRVTIPCTFAGAAATVVLRDGVTDQVRAVQALSLLPPGPECVGG